MKLALFASGSGTNVENITKHFISHPSITIDSIWTNNPKAGVIERMAAYSPTVHVFTKEELQSGALLEALQNKNIDGIVLAGFLLLIPTGLVSAFPNRIINIHPALLPKYGGKGMYGDNVHKAVFNAKEEKTGITIHYVNEHYDEGAILYQAEVALTPNDTPEHIAKKVHQLEYQYFPAIIEKTFLANV